MAIISSEFINNYPQTALVMHEQLKQVQSTKSKVFKSFLKFSGLDAGYAGRVLSDRFVKDNKRPIPTIRLEYPEKRIVGWAYHTGTDHVILLSKHFIDQIESMFDSNHSSEFIQDTFNKNRLGLPYGEFSAITGPFYSNVKLFLESILLHELVHWGRFVNGLASGPREALSADPNEISNEIGWKFVKDAYGRYLTPESLGIGR